MAEAWLKCSACRSDIAFGAKYFQCSVSTCNRARTRLVFCSVPCWDSHVATLRHRDAWAEDKIAPTKAAWDRELADQPPEPPPRIFHQRPGGPPAPPARPAPMMATPAPAPAAATAAPRRIVGEAPPAPS